MGDYEIRPIGRVRSPLIDRDQAPHQGRPAGVEAELVIEEKFLQGLDGIQAGDKLFVLCWFHVAECNTLRIHPRGDPAIPKRGIFATRSPDRPGRPCCRRPDPQGPWTGCRGWDSYCRP